MKVLEVIGLILTVVMYIVATKGIKRSIANKEISYIEIKAYTALVVMLIMAIINVVI